MLLGWKSGTWPVWDANTTLENGRCGGFCSQPGSVHGVPVEVWVADSGEPPLPIRRESMKSGFCSFEHFLTEARARLKILKVQAS